MRFFEKIAFSPIQYIKDSVGYAGNILRHKYNVFQTGREIGLPVMPSITHDLSKFTPSEFDEYRDYFKDGRHSKKEIDDFNNAVISHKLNNAHHNPKTIADKMETISDWYSADLRANNYKKSFPDFKEWWLVRKDSISNSLGNSVVKRIDKSLEKSAYKISDIKPILKTLKYSKVPIKRTKYGKSFYVDPNKGMMIVRGKNSIADLLHEYFHFENNHKMLHPYGKGLKATKEVQNNEFQASRDSVQYLKNKGSDRTEEVARYLANKYKEYVK